MSGKDRALTMPQYVQELGHISLISSADKLRLSVTSTASFHLPHSLATQDQTNTLKALTFGYIWTSRGVGCSLDIRILVDGKPLDSRAGSAILERLGRHVQDNKVWSQLCLSPELNANGTTSATSPDICIALKHGQNRRAKEPILRGWLLDKTDLIPPADVLRAEMDRIQVQFEFLGVPDEQVETRHLEPSRGNEPTAFLPRVQVARQSDHLTQFEDTVGRIMSLPLHVAASFGQFQSIFPAPVGFKQKQQKLLAGTEPADSNHIVSSSSEVSLKRRKYPQVVVDILQSWLTSHIGHPYPTLKEKQTLMQQTGLRKSQLDNWMVYARRKLPVKSSMEDDGEMLFQGLDPKDDLFEDEFTDLLSQSSEDTISLSKVSTTSSIPDSSSNASQSSSPIKPTMSLEVTAATNLIDGALQTLVGGYNSRMPLPPNVRVEKDAPEMLLSRIVPTMFNPGYRKLMAHNAHFLPTLTSSITNVLTTARTPSLKQKTDQLAAMPISPLTNGDNDLNLGKPSRISRVIQTCLFSMMQRTLYDPSATRRLFKKPKNDDPNKDQNEDSDSTPDLLDDKSPKSHARQWDDLLAHITSDDDFEDLLFGDEDEDDDLLDESERERLAIEWETEEMLFGDGRGGYDDVDGNDEYLLPGGESDCGEMLL